MNKIYLKNTTVSSEKSVQEIIREITSRHATKIQQDYNGGGVLIGLQFLIPVENGTMLPIALPARMDAMKKVLWRGLGPRARMRRSEEDMADTASKIVWRQLAAWVKAQMALVDLEMVRPEEVFLPYIQVAPNRSMFQAIVEGGFSMKALKGRGGE